MTRFAKLQAALGEQELDAMLLLSPVNRRYATGFPSSDGAVVLTEKEAFFFTDSRYIEAARQQVPGATIGEITGKMRRSDWLRQVLADCAGKCLGFEEEWLSYGAYLRLQEDLPGTELVPAQSIPSRLRAVKDKEELAAMAAAQAIAEAALERVLLLIRPGVRERDIAAELTYQMLLLGGEGNSFDPIVVAGRKSSMPHGVPGDETVSAGDFVTMDFGCLKDGYCSDMTRTVAVGSATAEMRRVYDTVLRAQEAGIAAVKAGVPGAAVHAAGADVIEKAGYGAYFGHAFGHSLGLEIHESPNFSPSEKRAIPAGAVISAEPGIYLPGRFGVRIEDVVCVTEQGCVNLTSAPKELLVL